MITVERNFSARQKPIAAIAFTNNNPPESAQRTGKFGPFFGLVIFLGGGGCS
jgi:hypothetical protein